jgi:hypothetical protein
MLDPYRRLHYLYRYHRRRVRDGLARDAPPNTASATFGVYREWAWRLYRENREGPAAARLNPAFATLGADLRALPDLDHARLERALLPGLAAAGATYGRHVAMQVRELGPDYMDSWWAGGDYDCADKYGLPDWLYATRGRPGKLLVAGRPGTLLMAYCLVHARCAPRPLPQSRRRFRFPPSRRERACAFAVSICFSCSSVRQVRADAQRHLPGRSGAHARRRPGRARRAGPGADAHRPARQRPRPPRRGV